MSDLRQAAQQALEALSCLEYDFCGITDGPSDDTTEAAITALRAALAVLPLYTAPPQRKPLTEEEISSLWDSHVVPVFDKNGINPIVFARAIESAHGIKDA